ncbi:MAG: pyridine nucleotide-disulfide oxidoreductase [Cryobacterium sp.]|nr:pyridine nucleotide-disulfide oxidoreductase [Cryobacterium sp.]
MSTEPIGTEQRFIIVGGGLAGARAAETMRAEGFDGRITVVAGEDQFPYIRPPLSKEFLTGQAELDTIYVHPEAWYREHRIDVLRGRMASDLAPGAHELTIADGEVMGYDKLLLATGASSRRFPGPGTELPGVHYLRTAEESAHVKTALEHGGRQVVIVGAGWIGLEVASASRAFGNTVTVLGRESIALNTVLGNEVGAVFDRLHRDNGVDLRMSTAVTGFVGDASGVAGVAFTGAEARKELVAADVVVVGIGAVPNIELAVTAGLEVSNGVVVDASFRTSDADIFAVGDVANVFHPVLGHHLRIEHWANAENAGKAAGKSMLGQAVSYTEIPYFYTDQFDLGMEYSGYGDLAKDADVVIRGNIDRRKFVAFWVAGRRVVAGMNVNMWDVNETVQDLIRSGAEVDPMRLADETIALEDVPLTRLGVIASRGD